MNRYGYLAKYYDRLTEDVDYNSFADYYKALFEKNSIHVSSVVDLACGTGTLTSILAGRGYDMTGVDASNEMLMEAAEKDKSILYLNQAIQELDLYGTYDAAVCCLDGINYCEPSSIRGIFERISLFVRPGGIFVFDILPVEHLKRLDGEIFVDEDPNFCCMWRAEFDYANMACNYGFDVFARRPDGLYERESEEHIEYAHSLEFLEKELSGAGFCEICTYGDRVLSAPDADSERIFISAIRH